MRVFIAAFCALVFASMMFGSASAQETLEVQNAWVRKMPDGFPTTAAYMRIINNGPEEIVVDRVESDRFGRVEIHDHLQGDDGIMRMRPIKGLKVAAGQALELAPMGKHLMLFDVKEKLTLGEIVNIVLFQGDRAVAEVKAEVARAKK